MKRFKTSGRARTVVAAAAVGMFASLGGAGYAAGLVHFHHASPNKVQYPPSKVTICHHTHSQKNPSVTITVSEHAVPAHLRHGDTIGPCSEQQGAPATKKHVKAPKVHQNRGHHGDKSHGNKNHGAPTSKPAKGNHGLAKGHSVNHGPNAVHGHSTAQIKGKSHGKGKSHSPTKAHGPGHGQGHGQGHGPDATHGNSGGGKGNGHKP